MQNQTHIRTVTGKSLKETAEKGGCGKCRASCQSACKTSCTVANQPCESQNKSITKTELCKTRVAVSATSSSSRQLEAL